MQTEGVRPKHMHSPLSQTDLLCPESEPELEAISYPFFTSLMHTCDQLACEQYEDSFLNPKADEMTCLI